MEKLAKKIEIVNLAKNQNKNSQPQPNNQNQPPQKYQQKNTNPEWKTDQAGRGYWDYGNGMGWMPENKYYDQIIDGFNLPNWQKENLFTGPSGPVSVFNNGIVTKW